MTILTGADTMSRLFDLDWQLLADASLMIIAIFFLFLFMSYFLFNPARAVLENRRNKIKTELEESEASKLEALALKEEYEARLAQIDKEAEEILSDARRKALENENEIIAAAKQEAARIKDRAHAEAELEKQKIADDVKREIITVASAMAGKIVAASMNTQIQEELIDETLKELGEETWLSK